MVMDKKSDGKSSVASAFTVNVLIFCISILNFQPIVDASCAFNDGKVGECVKFEECRSAVALSRKGVNPGFCNLEEGTVCCPDYRNPHRERRPTQKWSSQALSTNAHDAFEDDQNFQRKKHSVGNVNTANWKKKTHPDIIEEPYRFETPNSFYSDSGVENNKPSRQSSQPQHHRNEESYFVPPGLAKKKSWREEKTTENDFYYEHVTKKPNRGPNRKGPNKHNGNNHESNNGRKWGDVNTTRRPGWYDQGGRRTTDNWYNGQNTYENSYNNQRTTPKRSNWEQETYITTKRPYSSTDENIYPGNEDEYLNIKPTRRPQTSNPSSFNRPNHQVGSHIQGSKRPNYQQGSNIDGNRPDYQEGFHNQGNKRPSHHQGPNFEDNQPNHQQGYNFQGNHPSSGTHLRKRISEQKCEEYSKQVTENVTGLPLTTNPDPVIIPVRKCITPQQLIVGGENTTLGEFPHMAAIGFRGRNKKEIAWNCGGSLISEQFVMTAAHCTSTSSGRPVRVRLGEYNLLKNDDGAYPVDYGIAEIITHPDYKPPSKYNDIALLKLSRKVTFYKHIRPACLYLEDTFSASKALATGWGRVHYEGETSEILQKVVLSIVDNHTCNRIYKINEKTGLLPRGIVDSQLCAGELTGGKDTCQGDSGGPLSITSSTCIHHIIGITSFGKACAVPNSTGVYTRVSAYVPWIESIVWSAIYN